MSVFSPNIGKSGPEKTPYLDTFHAVKVYKKSDITIIISVNESIQISNKSSVNKTVKMTSSYYDGFI